MQTNRCTQTTKGAIAMSNNQLKKQRAIEFNQKHQERLALEKDQRDNPEKYKKPRDRKAEHHAKMWLACVAGLTA